ncbi:MAG: phosphate ABC transporter permease PstA [Betaproteobacteria bacterium]|jgi:phosphate transport system permease protein|nr:MAG: phosphate ABC transporter permease PstA [Betaproteobacteria bacterium]
METGTFPTQGGRKPLGIIQAGLAKRKAAETRFKTYGIVAIAAGLVFLAILFISIVGNAYTAFQQTQVKLDLYLDPDVIDPEGTRDLDVLSGANYAAIVRSGLQDQFPDVESRRDRRALNALVGRGATYDLRATVMAVPDLVGETLTVWVPADDDVDMLLKGNIDREAAEEGRRLSDQQLAWIDQLESRGRLAKRFNADFFTKGDSREPESAGIRGAVVGSFYTMLVTLLLSFPLGVAAAVYLEEFAPQNRFTDIIEVNINNLAAVPSIVFGLLGLAVFINFFGLPRSVPLVGGLVLTLMTLPTIIIASRATLKAVPPSIREAALGVGASQLQTVVLHVLPLAMPGMLTGAIIGMARALGETAPLLMIGMVAFIVDIPQGILDPATALPVQIFLWADSPERAFVERTSAATLVLLFFLIVMNALAVVLRKRFERRW